MFYGYLYVNHKYNILLCDPLIFCNMAVNMVCTNEHNKWLTNAGIFSFRHSGLN